MNTRRPGLSFFLGFVLVLALAAGCAGTPRNSRTAVAPFLPPRYYECIETAFIDLMNSYFIDTRNDEVLWDAEANYNGKIFVIKNVVVTPADAGSATPEYIWIGGRLQCYGLVVGSASSLRPGDKLDIVGVNAGLNKDFGGSLVWNGCVFPPAGCVQLPAVQNSGLNPTSIY